jgi:hypothetical protein
MYESIYKNNEVENEVSLDMSYFWYSDACWVNLPLVTLEITYSYSKVKNNFTKKYKLLLATICVASS